MINREIEIREAKMVGRAISAVAFGLWGVFPMLMLGWLFSAVTRHDSCNSALKDDPAYQLVVHSGGGINSLPPILLVGAFLIVLFILSYISRRLGYSEPNDGMARGRLIVKKLVIPAYLSSSAFLCGNLARGTTKTMLATLVLLAGISCLAVLAHYFADTTQDI